MNYLDTLQQFSKNENIYIYGAGSYAKIFFDSWNKGDLYERNSRYIDIFWCI